MKYLSFQHVPQDLFVAKILRFLKLKDNYSFLIIFKWKLEVLFKIIISVGKKRRTNDDKA